MSDQNDEDTSTETEGSEPEVEETDEQIDDEGQEPEGDEAPPAEKEDDLPEWARKALTNARAEAANYRTKLRAAEQQIREAKTPEDFEAARAELTEQVATLEREILVRDIAADHKLTKEFVEVIRDLAEAGKSEADLKARAEALAKFVPHDEDEAPESLSGGLDPHGDHDDEPSDPGELARKFGRGRRKF